MSDEKKDAPTISLSDVAQKTDLEFPMVVWAWERRGPYLTVNMRSADWPTFWQSLTAQETAAALRAAPHVATAWDRYDECWGNEDGGLETEPRWYRDTECGPELHSGSPAVVRKYSDTWGWRATNFEWHEAASLEAAKSAADAALHQAGWVLL